MSFSNPANPLKRFLNGNSSNITFEGSLPSVVLQADGWDENNEQTVTIPGVLADESKQVILPTPASVNQDAFYAAGIRIISQSVDAVIFRCNSIPDEDLTVYVAVMKPKSSDDSDSVEGVYSTEETKIGRWIDGKPVYRRVYVTKSPSIESSYAAISSEITTLDSVVSLAGLLKSGQTWMVVPFAASSGSYVGVRVSGKAIEMSTYHPSGGFKNLDAVMTIEYTKTTDTVE